MSEPAIGPSPIEHANKVIGQVMIGRCDGGLVEIVKACAARTREIGSAWQWRMTFTGTVNGVEIVDDVWDLDTVQIGELSQAEILVGNGTSYMELDPKRLMWHRVVILVAHLHKVHGVPLAAAIGYAEKLSHKEQDDMIDMYEVSAAPKDEASPSSSPSA